MATLLLSRPEKTTRGQDLRRTLLHLLHGFQAVENALTIFALPFSSHAELLAIAGHPEILAQFDAHVGDTACHMRAQMIWELYEYYKLAERREWVIIALEALARVKFQTVALMLALHKKNGYMRALGFGSVISFGQLFDKVGWTGFLDNFDQKVRFFTSRWNPCSNTASHSAQKRLRRFRFVLQRVPNSRHTTRFGTYRPFR